MAYLLDSDWFLDVLFADPAALALIDRLSASGVSISIITYMEGYQSVLRARDPDRARHELEDFLLSIPVLPFSPPVARRCASLRERLRTAGRRVRPRALDLMIASTAIEHELALVTRNLDDYNDIPDLRLYP